MLPRQSTRAMECSEAPGVFDEELRHVYAVSSPTSSAEITVRTTN